MKKNFSGNIDWRIFFGSTGLFVGACIVGFMLSAALIQNLF